MSNTTTNFKHIDANMTPDRLVHASLLGKLFAEIEIAHIYNPNNAAINALKVIVDEMGDDLKAWRSAPVDLDDQTPRHRNSAECARMTSGNETLRVHNSYWHQA
jgi:hypothetical protein